MTFDELGVNEKILEALGYMNFTQATPIQQQAIPTILADHDLLACAQTGTGKTAAFVIPVIQQIQERNPGKFDTLIICPTRELAQQIDVQIEGLSYFTGVTSYAVYGGGSGEGFDYEKRALTQGSEIVVATPGRILSHLRLGYVDLSDIKHFVLDEADRMLDMGFYNDIMEIYKYLPKEKQTLLFSATMPPKIRTLAMKLLAQPKEINIAIAKPAEGINQRVFMVYERNKVALIKHILKQKEYESVIIFCSKKADVNTVVAHIKKMGHAAKGISSNLEQEEREGVLREFRNKEYSIIVATDIMARGIDIKEISLVINYEVPPDADDYVHRIGRTARASTTGEAITFISDEDQYKFVKIEKLIEKNLEKEITPIEIGESPAYKSSSSGKKGGYQGKKKYNNKNKNSNRNNHHNKSGTTRNNSGGKEGGEQGQKKSKFKPRENKKD